MPPQVSRMKVSTAITANDYFAANGGGPLCGISVEREAACDARRSSTCTTA
jgi:hypothetical protein